MGEGYIFAPLFGCLLIIKYMLYVLLYNNKTTEIYCTLYEIGAT